MTFHIFLGFLLLVGNSLGLILGLAIAARRVKLPSVFRLGMKLVVLDFVLIVSIISIAALLSKADFLTFYIYLNSMILSTLGVMLFILAGPGLAERSLTMFLISAVDSSQSGQELETLRRVSQFKWWGASDQTEIRVNEQIDAGVFNLNEYGIYEITPKGRIVAIGIRLISKVFGTRQSNAL